MKKPNALILKTDGINCDEETTHALRVAGASPETVHINQLRSGEQRLKDFGILALSGGFSYGDDIASGRVLANELTSFLTDEISEFTEQDRPIIGICNGFQVLVKMGLLPSRNLGHQTATLAHNDVGRFVCRWVDLSVEDSVCKFIQPDDVDGSTIPMQVAHGEGKFIAPSEQIEQLSANKHVVFRYANRGSTDGDVTFPANPNGSTDNIAGICDEKGVILGLMPHPERSISSFHPDRQRTAAAQAAGKLIFRNIVKYAKEL